MPGRKEHQTIEGVECKHCPTCDSWKPLEAFGNQSSSWDGKARMCRDDFNRYKAEKRATDPKYKETDKRAAANRDNMAYYRANREKVIEKMIVYNKERYNNDPEYKLLTLTRRRASKEIEGEFKGKGQLLGCTPDVARKHIESQWREGMSWENHSIHGWHIDHIVPICSFDKTDPEWMKKAFHYTNLQPLWATENLQKGGK